MYTKNLYANGFASIISPAPSYFPLAQRLILSCHIGTVGTLGKQRFLILMQQNIEYLLGTCFKLSKNVGYHFVWCLSRPPLPLLWEIVP
jgi:hypothetical protein